MSLTGIKHLVRCRCILPQFKNTKNPPLHEFTVFSVLDEDTDEVTSKFVQCTNCGVVHKVHDIGRSEILSGKEQLGSMLTLDDVKQGMPKELVTLLEQYDAEIPNWEHAKFILENQLWGDFIVLKQETIGGMKQGKYLRILGEKLYKVDVFSRSDTV